jgi:hypothetical protein
VRFGLQAPKCARLAAPPPPLVKDVMVAGEKKLQIREINLRIRQSCLARGAHIFGVGMCRGPHDAGACTILSALAEAGELTEVTVPSKNPQVTLKPTVFWAIRRCNLLKVNRVFRRKINSPSSGSKNNEASNLNFSGLHCVISQKMELSITARPNLRPGTSGTVSALKQAPRQKVATQQTELLFSPTDPASSMFLARPLFHA